MHLWSRSNPRLFPVCVVYMHLRSNCCISNSLPHCFYGVIALRFCRWCSVVYLLHSYIDSVGYVGISNIKNSPP